MNYKQLVRDAQMCRHCEGRLELGPNPVFWIHPEAEIVLIGQAPGIRVHNSGIPWNDRSGDRLRKWLDVDKETFYNNPKIAIMPMGFCYPGKGKNGDLPPLKDCSEKWHSAFIQAMPKLRLYILIGKYANDYYLKEFKLKSLTEAVSRYEEFLPLYLPMPHPSPRNIRWFKQNPWFEEELVPLLQSRVREVLT